MKFSMKACRLRFLGVPGASRAKHGIALLFRPVPAPTGLKQHVRFHQSFLRGSGGTSYRIDRFRQLLIFYTPTMRPSAQGQLPICFHTMVEFASSIPNGPSHSSEEALTWIEWIL
jgi:hypothetical protein